MLDKHLKLEIKANNMKRVFVVSDTHGCLDILLDTLASVNFSTTDDHLLIINGDLIDRGQQSFEMLEWYDRANREGWCFATLGNHEHMLICAYENPSDNSYIFYANGGQWFKSLSTADKKECYRICKTLSSCIEVQLDNGKHLIVHAQYNDSNFIGDYSNDGFYDDDEYEDLLANAVWGRTSATNARYGSVLSQHTNKEYKSIVHGHTPNQKPIVVENLYFIDTGVVFGNGSLFTMLELNTLKLTGETP